MKKMYVWLSIVLLAVMFNSCSNNADLSDAYGNFESDEIIVSAETMGNIIGMYVDEGKEIKENDLIANIDTVQLTLKREQLIAAMNAINSKVQKIAPQLDVLEKKKSNLVREKTRVERLLKENAATTKQLDDINGELEVVVKQIAATLSSMNTANSGLLSEREPLRIQIEQIDDQIKKSTVRSPISGTVLTRFMNIGEFASTGKPIIKIANLDIMTLRVYISGNQLPKVKLGQKVKVIFDKNAKENQSAEGEIVYISNKAEFTPKIIQTKEERVNLVYAIKVKIKNDGRIKIGMPGEIKF